MADNAPEKQNWIRQKVKRLPTISLLILLLSAFGLWGCQNSPNSHKEPATAEAKLPCPELDSLWQHIHLVEAALESPQELPKAPFEKALGALEQNLHRNDADCHYLNHKYFPERNRFQFIEHLTERCIQDTLDEGIYYLIRLRGMFAADPEVTEFLSEEIAHIAIANPSAYADYLERNPHQKNLLLQSTRWPETRLDELIRAFEREGARDVTQFLRELRTENQVPPTLVQY